jgi:hypothetical protein
MGILAVGVRYDPLTKQRQAVVVVTHDDGRGHPDHLIPHKAEAEFRGHGWLDIHPSVYASFGTVSAENFGDVAATLDEHLAKVLA